MKKLLNPFAAAAVLSACAILLISAPANAQKIGAWKKLSNMPMERWEAGTIVLDEKLYFFGGYRHGVKGAKTSHIYDPKDGSWTPFQDLPSAVTHLNYVLDGRTVWFAGGFKDGYKGHTIAEVWSYDINKDRYTAAPLLPETRGGGGLALVGRKLHYFGGIEADRETDSGAHWVLDLDEWAKGSAKWTNAAPMPVPRNQLSTVVLDDKIYAIGGQFHHDSRQIDQKCVDIYDSKTDSWSQGPSLPKGHSHSEAATFVYDGKIILVGGHTTADGESKKIEDDIIALKPGGKWNVIGTLPNPLSSPVARVIGNQFFVAGGCPKWPEVTDEMWVATIK